ncbi:MAG TPA: glycosyl hydrolase family 28-related protein, partial [Candidatus Saccharimonadales bacterium]
LAGKSNTGHSHSNDLDSLTDVTITAPGSGQVLKYNGSAWINDTDATGSGTVPSGTNDQDELYWDATGGQWAVAPAHFLDVTREPYNADNTGSANASSAIQAALDDVAAAGGGTVYVPPGNYRIDTGLNIDEYGVRLVGAGHQGWALSGNTPATTAWTVGPTLFLSNQAIHIITIDSGSSGGDWRGAAVEGLGFGDYSASHNTVLSAIRITRGHGINLRSLNIANLEAGNGIFIDPAVTNGVQYTLIEDVRTEEVLKPFTGGTNRCQDVLITNCWLYCNDNIDGGVAGSLVVDFSNIGDVDVISSRLQFGEALIYFDDDFGKLLGTSLEQSSGWTNGSADYFIRVGANARWTMIDDIGMANLAKAADVIRVDTGAADTVIGIHITNTSPMQHAVTTDTGTRTYNLMEALFGLTGF